MSKNADATARNRRDHALATFERKSELPLVVLALAMLPVLVIPLAVGLNSTWQSVFEAIAAAIWVAFALEFLVRLALSRRRWRFILRNWIDVLIISLPFLRPLRIARSGRALRLLRLSRLATFITRIGEGARRLLTAHQLHYVILATGILTVGAAGLIVPIERSGEQTSIQDFGDALWWAFGTVTTVGYGDVVPVTASGRWVAAGLLVCGITLFAAVSANLAAFILERGPASRKGPAADPVIARLDQVMERLQAVEKGLARLSAQESRRG